MVSDAVRSSETVLFLSSTVQDFEGIRDEIAVELRDRGFIVRLSEDPAYPVAPGVTSHDACLAAVRTSHIFVLLVGQRFGGLFRKQNKSITWREWDEAMLVGLHPIVLVQESANDIAQVIATRRKQLLEVSDEVTLSELEVSLRAEFPDAKPDKQNLPAVQRFIDELRKGHDDNWVHSWDGTTAGALKVIHSRINAMLATFQAAQQHARAQAQRQYLSLDAINTLAAFAGLLIGDSKRDAASALGEFLEQCAKLRSELFGFRGTDRHNLAVHSRKEDMMIAGPCVRHESIPRHGRAWKVGRGHVGLAIQQNSLLVTGDVRQSDGWVYLKSTEGSDRSHYVSAITVPLYVAGSADAPDATFTVTSSRIDHFADAEQPEVLTAQVLGNIVSVLLKTKETRP